MIVANYGITIAMEIDLVMNDYSLLDTKNPIISNLSVFLLTQTAFIYYNLKTKFVFSFFFFFLRNKQSSALAYYLYNKTLHTDALIYFLEKYTLT